MQELEIFACVPEAFHIRTAILVTLLLVKDSRQVQLQVPVIRSLGKQGANALFGTVPVRHFQTFRDLRHKRLVPVESLFFALFDQKDLYRKSRNKY